ncbi:MAG: SpoIIE family protein phosphatase [Gracilibacteraceae bacterium]|jgi:serine/threonine protein phosphatase PrpC|nr:SpoIIE family protein phosphatase [Gracilibacteraceae bacterium]
MEDSIRFQVAVRSIVGAREEQQDAVYVHADGSKVLAVVCDGMGGLRSGRLAGLTAVAKMKELYFAWDRKVSAPNMFLRAVDILDESVYGLKDEEGVRLAAGATIVAAVIEGGDLFWLSVGDSRLYLLRQTEIVKVTREHNYFLRLNRLLEEGGITPAEYEREAGRGEALISYIGVGGVEIMDINSVPFRLAVGDTVLLASDGLYKTLTDDEIKRHLGADAGESAAALIKAVSARRNAGQDNTTCVVIKCRENDTEESR